MQTDSDGKYQMFEKVVARRLKKQRSSDANFEAKNAGYRKIRSREARKMLKKAINNRRLGI